MNETNLEVKIVLIPEALVVDEERAGMGVFLELFVLG